MCFLFSAFFVEKKVPYEQFYDGAIEFFESNPDLMISKLYFDIKRHAEEMSLGVNNRKMMFEPCGDVTWDDHEYIVLHVLEKFDLFYDEILPFLKTFDISDDVFEDLLAYQKNIIRRPFDENKTISLNYDIHSFLKDIYVNDIHALEKRKNTLAIRDSMEFSSWREFSKIVIWYGKMGWSSYKDIVEEI